MLAVGYGLSFVGPKIGGPMLDLLFTTSQANARLAQMTAEQKHIHILATLTLDVLYPIFNFAVLGGLAYRLAKVWRKWMVVPAALYFIFDILENICEVLILGQGAHIMALKTIFSTAKFGFFSLATLLVLFLVGRAVFRALFARPT